MSWDLDTLRTSLPLAKEHAAAAGIRQNPREVTIPVVLFETSTCSVQIITCLVVAAGTLLDLQKAIESVLGSHDVIRSISYRASRVNLDSSLGSFASGGSDGPRFQASYTKPLSVIVRDPSGQQLHHLFRF